MNAARRAALRNGVVAVAGLTAASGYVGSSPSAPPRSFREGPKTSFSRPGFCECAQRSFPKFDHDWDARHPANSSVACQGNTRIILLVRHGQYETRGGLGYGRLTEVGREQARMAGRHIAARMREDASLKRAMYRMTSSALERAVETADIMQSEIEEELAWVDVPCSRFPSATKVRVVRKINDAYVEAVIEGPIESFTHEDAENLLQSRVDINGTSRLRVRSTADVGAIASVSELAGDAKTVSVHSPLQQVKRLDARFDEWECSGCKKEAPPGDVHWSDEAETTGVGFCDECYSRGPKHKRLKDGDTLSRVTEGVLSSALRMPNDKNLNEADVDIASVLLPEDPLFEDYGKVNAQILRDHAAVEAAFHTHFHRAVDHKRLKRAARNDVIPFAFAGGGTKHERRLTADEFGKLELQEVGGVVTVPFLLDENADTRVEGPFTLTAVGEKDFSAAGSVTTVQAEVSEARKRIKSKRPGKQVEIFVVHQNLIRYMFLRAMQFDTTSWLNFGGSNCTMTQLRITRKGDVICDFFGDHGSAMPVSHYTFNKSPDV